MNADCCDATVRPSFIRNNEVREGISDENQRKILEASLKNCKKTENIEKDFQASLKTVYEKLIDENISTQEKFNISHTIIDKIEFDKSAQTLYLSYKYQM